jgi:hypothetical protein
MTSCYCKKPDLLDNLCGEHFILQHLQPIRKELDNAKSLVAQLTNSLGYQEARLKSAQGLRRHFERLDEDATEYNNTHKPNKYTAIERRSMVAHGALAALDFVFCRKCGDPFELVSERSLHENTCVSHKPVTKKEAKQAKQNKIIVLTEDDLEGLE